MSNEIKKSDFPFICRFCLLKKNNMISIFKSNVITMIQSCTSIKIIENDLPNMLCGTCKRTFNRFYKFKKQCEKSDDLLQHILENSENESDKNEQVFDNVEIKLEDSIAISNLLDVSSSNLENIGGVKYKIENKSCNMNSGELVKIEQFFNEKISNNQPEVNESICTNMSNSNSNNLIENLLKPCDRVPELHMKSESKDISDIIDIWDHSQSTAENIQLESSTDNFDINILICDVCKKAFLTQTKLNRHKRTHNERKHECDICGKQFKEKSKLKRHLTVHMPQEEKLPCLYCDKIFAYECNLKEHHKKYHEGQLKKTLCTVCGKEFINIKTHRQIHQKDPTVKPFKCEKCPKEFQINISLIKHIKMKHEDNPPPATKLCSICGISCYTATGFKSHMAVHTNERSFSCDYCEKTFKLKGALIIHVRKHTGERPYVCTVCPKTFISSTDLKRHIIIHTNRRPYVCNVCGKGFKQSSTLKTHMKVH